jgi:type II secretion system protein N
MAKLKYGAMMSAVENLWQKINLRAKLSKNSVDFRRRSESDGAHGFRIGRYVGFTVFFFISFFCFLYLTFPYEVLKESLSQDLGQMTGYDIRIGKMSPSLPLGMKLEKISISKAGSSNVLSLDEVKVKVSVLSLFVGRLSPSLTLNSGKGSLEVNLGLAIFDLVGGNPIPRFGALKAQNLSLDQFISFLLASLSSGPGADPLIGPFLGNLAVLGSLNGMLEFELDEKNATQSIGKVDLSLANAVLKMDHDSLGFPNLVFKPAGIKAKIQNGNLQVDESSGFYSDDLKIQTLGKIILKPNLTASQLDLQFVIQLDKDLKEKIGFVLDAIRGTATADGKLTIQVRGPLSQPVVNNF